MTAKGFELGALPSRRTAVGRGLFGLILLSIVFATFGGPANAQETLRLRVGTTVFGSGLADVLVPAFTRDTGIDVALSAAGSGRSLWDARNGALDVLLVNAPEAEAEFMAEGSGVERRPVLRDVYILVGPAADPANVRQAESIGDAFQKIYWGQSPFVTRADDSGNNQAELAIWSSIGVEPFGDWYYETGLGIQRSLAIAGGRDAYMLVDRATWLRHGEEDQLQVLLAGDSAMENIYSVITVNPVAQPSADLEAANRFLNWLTSSAGTELVRSFQIAGQTPFAPIETGEP